MLIHPVFQDCSQIALRSRRHAPSNSESSSSGLNSKLPQSAYLLPLKYGQFLDEKLVEPDPFYVLHDLFQFTAMSELQFLSLIKRKITMISRGTGEGRVLELQLLKATLDEHNEILADNLETFKARGSTMWPGVSSYFRITASQFNFRMDPTLLLYKQKQTSPLCSQNGSIHAYSPYLGSSPGAAKTTLMSRLSKQCTSKRNEPLV